MDLDPQGCLTFSLGHNPDRLERSVNEVLAGDLDAVDAVLKTDDGMDLLPATIDLAGAEALLLMRPGREFALKRALSPLLGSYDVIIIDCPPSLGCAHAQRIDCGAVGSGSTTMRNPRTPRRRTAAAYGS